MLSDALLYAGSGIIFLWGVAHLAAVRPVVEGFGALSSDNRRIITMEWIAEGLVLCFVGTLGFLLIAPGASEDDAALVLRALAVFLVLLALLSALTGARTSVLPMRMCPLVKTGAAMLLFLGSVL